MLRRKLREMIKEYGRILTHQMLIEDIKNLETKMAKASNIYLAIDIEHEILDRKSMLKWLKESNV